MKIDKKLNFVSTVSRDDGSLIYLHVVPFPYDVVENNCLLLGGMFNNFFTLVGSMGAPRVAAMMLRQTLKSQQDDGRLPAGPTIVDDIQRLTTVIWSDVGVWKTCPLDTALKQGILSDDEYREVEGEIVFFMVSSAIQKPSLFVPTIGKALEMYSGRLVLLSATAFKDSLLTSKTDTDTPAPPAQQELSHIPS